MRMALLFLIATPAFATPHSGAVKVRTGPEPSDIALFVIAALGVWLVRRALRTRFARRPGAQSED